MDKAAKVVDRPKSGHFWVDVKIGDVVLWECVGRERAEEKVREINAALSAREEEREREVRRLREAGKKLISQLEAFKAGTGDEINWNEAYEIFFGRQLPSTPGKGAEG